MINVEIREVITSKDNSPELKERIISLCGSVCNADELAVVIQELTLAQKYLTSLEDAGLQVGTN